MKKLLFFAIAIIGFSATSFGQSISEAASATATLIVPISIEKTVNMNFGTLSSSNTAGHAVLNPATGVLTPDGGVRKVTGGATPSAAEFVVTGEKSKTFAFSFPATIDLLGTNDASKKLTLTLSVDDAGPLTIDASSGTKTIKLGGSLSIPALSVADVYVNDTELKVTCNYN